MKTILQTVLCLFGPPGYMETPKQLNQEDYDKVKAEWETQYTGIAREHQVPVSEHYFTDVAWRIDETGASGGVILSVCIFCGLTRWAPGHPSYNDMHLHGHTDWLRVLGHKRLRETCGA